MFIYVQEQSEDLVVAFIPKGGVGGGWGGGGEEGGNWTFIYLF